MTGRAGLRLAILVAVLAAALVPFVLLVPSPISPCFDSGGWWDSFARKCQCTDAELADPTLSSERKAACEAHTTRQ